MQTYILLVPIEFKCDLFYIRSDFVKRKSRRYLQVLDKWATLGIIIIIQISNLNASG